jgi:hypothetical protein
MIEKGNSIRHSQGLLKVECGDIYVANDPETESEEPEAVNVRYHILIVLAVIKTLFFFRESGRIEFKIAEKMDVGKKIEINCLCNVHGSEDGKLVVWCGGSTLCVLDGEVSCLFRLCSVTN